jgi:aldose 1-epimerase
MVQYAPRDPTPSPRVPAVRTIRGTTMADLILRSEGLEAGLKPEVGGAFTHFADVSGPEPIDLLRRSKPGFDDVLDSSGFALVPFCNRVRDGRFTFRGRDVQLSPNLPPQKHPLHGQGWRGAWTVLDSAEHFAQLGFHHDAGEWPWTYEAQLTVALTGRAMQVTLACRNLSEDAMPCGLGLHPYYPCNGQTVLDTDAQAVWTVDDEVMPVERVPADGHYRLKDRQVCGQGLDNGYDGWSGEARIRWPDKKRCLLLTSEAPRFQLFSPSEGGLIAAEPVTNANGALNYPESDWKHLGLWVLDPDQSCEMTARFEVVEL